MQTAIASIAIVFWIIAFACFLFAGLTYVIGRSVKEARDQVLRAIFNLSYKGFTKEERDELWDDWYKDAIQKDEVEE